MTRPYADDIVDVEDEGEVWNDPTVLSRGWAFARLVGLVLICGLGAGVTVGVTLWIALTALNSSL